MTTTAACARGLCLHQFQIAFKFICQMPSTILSFCLFPLSCSTFQHWESFSQWVSLSDFRWSKYWASSFSISPSNKHLRLDFLQTLFGWSPYNQSLHSQKSSSALKTSKAPARSLNGYDTISLSIHLSLANGFLTQETEPFLMCWRQSFRAEAEAEVEPTVRLPHLWRGGP